MMRRIGGIGVLVLALAVGAAAQDWTEHVIDNSFPGAYGIWGVDFDGDGDTDVAACGGSVSWHENLGDGQWTEHVLAASYDTKDVCAGDFNGDGFPDVAATSYTPGDIRVFLNNGNDPWDTIYVTSDFSGGFAVAAEDIDGDGDIDIAGAAWAGDDAAWFENDGTGTSWTAHSLTDNTYDNAHGVAIADLSGDGMPDVVASSGGVDNTVWWENSGDDLWPYAEIGSDDDYSSAVHCFDMDDDGDMDVASAIYSDDMMLWWENDGMGGFTEHIADGFFDGAWNLHLDDVDDDGDGDIVAGSRFVGITWWEQLDGDFVRHDLNTAFSDVRAVHVADMDGDNDLDILGAAQGDNALRWWEQPGQGQPDLVTLDAIPQNPPIEVPAGGSFLWSFHFAYALPQTIGGVFWTEIEIPNGQVFGPIQQVPWTFTPGQDFTVNNIGQDIPQFAPVGGYIFSAHAGLSTNTPLLTDSFGFTVIAASTTGGATDWTATGLERILLAGEAPEDEGQRPTAFAVSEAYPNPFNNSSRVSITLPDTREVTVRVHDTLGRLQTELVSGAFGPGVHHLTVDANDWASGMYFIQVRAGHDTALRKLVLVK